MKCNNCEYLCYPECESNYTACQVFGDSVPDEYERKDGEGCICNRRQLAKIFRQNEEAIAEAHEAFVKWFLGESEDN